MKLGAILFDAGGILYHRPRRWQRTKAFLSELDLDYIDAKHPDRIALKIEAHAGRISADVYHNALLDLFGVGDPSNRLRGKCILYEEERDIEFHEGVPETLHRLKSWGKLLGVVTNTYISTEEKLAWFRRVGIGDIWDSFATSCEIGIIKPDPRIYRAALDPIGVPLGEAAFVGHTAVELAGAKSLGMTSIAFNRDDDQVVADYIIVRFPGLIELLVPKDG